MNTFVSDNEDCLPGAWAERLNTRDGISKTMDTIRLVNGDHMPLSMLLHPGVWCGREILNTSIAFATTGTGSLRRCLLLDGFVTA